MYMMMMYTCDRASILTGTIILDRHTRDARAGWDSCVSRKDMNNNREEEEGGRQAGDSRGREGLRLREISQRSERSLPRAWT